MCPTLSGSFSGSPSNTCKLDLLVANPQVKLWIHGSIWENRGNNWRLNEDEIQQLQIELAKIEAELGVNLKQLLASFHYYLNEFYGKLNLDSQIVTSSEDSNYAALWSILQKNYELKLSMDRDTPPEKCNVRYTVNKDDNWFQGVDLIEILGLISLWETRGDDWRLEEDEAREVKAIEKEADAKAGIFD